MKIHLFTRTEKQGSSAFRTYYVRENLKVLKAIGAVYFVSVFAIMLSVRVFNLDMDRIVNIPGFVSSFYSTLLISPLFYLAGHVLQTRFKNKKRFVRFSQLLCIAFSLYLVSRGMLNTFYAVHNPRNSVTMYMIWLVTVSVFFVFEYYETLFIALVCALAFTVLLPYYQTDPAEVIKNQFVSVVLLAIFFFSSRHVYSYRASHFVQLKTIREKNLEIENANHIKDEILGIVAHDLRNPLAAIESIAMMMKMDIDEQDADMQENLMVIRASCDKARSIINDLLEVAKNDSLENFGLEETEMNSFLADITAGWMHNKNGIVQLVFTGTKKPVVTQINKEKMQRVMDNLISNAIKFSKDGDRIEVLLKHEKSNFFIEVKDIGLGIPNEMLPYVFDRFSKAGRKGVRGEDSIGMGLNIARQIIKKHGGDITVESVEQQGTTFTIALPNS